MHPSIGLAARIRISKITKPRKSSWKNIRRVPLHTAIGVRHQSKCFFQVKTLTG
jgi:hypothetical protein